MRTVLNYDNFSYETEVTMSDIMDYLSEAEENEEIIKVFTENKDFINWLKSVCYDDAFNEVGNGKERYVQMSFFDDLDFLEKK